MKARSPARDAVLTPLENLTAFARLYGYVRFFHPTLAAERAPWRSLAALGCEMVVDAPNVGALIDRLEAQFADVAPTLQLWVAPESAPPPRKAPPRRHGLVYWQHLGFEGSPLTVYRPPYARVRVTPSTLYRRRFTERPSDDAVIETALLGGLWARVAMVLPARGEVAHKKRPDADDEPAPDPEELLDVDDVSNAAVRYGTIVETWNVLRHFFPYQQDLDIDWGEALTLALRQAGEAEDREQLQAAVRGLVTRLEDGHGKVGFRRSPQRASLPFALDLLDGQAVVVATDAPELFVPGDVIESIDDADPVAGIERLERALSGSPQWRRFRAAAWEYPQGEADKVAEVRRVRAGKTATLEVRYQRRDPPVGPRPPAIATLADGIRYVDLTRAEWSEIEPILPDLAAARGVVFDLRGYPIHNDRILNHLLREAETAQWMHVPRIIEPDGHVVAWHDLGWNRSPAEPHIGGEVVFLSSAAAISYGESMLSYVHAHDLGTLIGRPSAGANGDIVRLDTLGGIYVIFSGMRVTDHAGNRFHALGVRPQIEVVPTAAGLAAGRDEELDTALEHIRGRLAEKKPGE